MAPYSAKELDRDEAKKLFLKRIAKGETIATVLLAVGRDRSTYDRWRAQDPHFRQAVDDARNTRIAQEEVGVSEVGLDKSIDFATWRKEYLGYETYAHQQQWVDVLEGRDPTPIEGTEYRKANPSRVIINTPPGHSKTQTITIDYVTYRICMDPNVRIILVSKRREQAQKFLYQIKQRLTSKRFAKLQAAYAPKDGWQPQRGEGSFAQNVIYIAGRTADHRDPTVEVLGLGSQIYGSRADLIILDDVVVLANAGEYDKQIEWLTSEVENRTKGGKVLVVGTRLKSLDAYGELLNGERYMTGESPWTYLRQPLVLDFGESLDPSTWRTLWPKSTSPFDTSDDAVDENGMYTMFDGEKANEIRARSSAQVWSMVYQQSPMSDDSVFKPTAVYGSMNRMRKPGPLTAGAAGHPRTGSDGMYTIASMDPAMAGDTFVLVGKVDRTKKRRYIEQAFVQTRPTPEWIREIIKTVTVQFGVNEWVIESNAFQLFLTKDPEITNFLQQRGVRLVPHHTSKNKADPDFGVSSLEPLFGTIDELEHSGRKVHAKNNLIELPDAEYSKGIKALVEQLLTWEPGIHGSKLKQDGPMALWFWELRARLILGYGHERNGPATDFVKTRFTTNGALHRQGTKPRSPFGNYIRTTAREFEKEVSGG